MLELEVPSHRSEIVADGKRLEVVSFDPPRACGTTVVLLHEGLGSVALWKSFPRALAQRTGARVVAYSRHGHGDSEVLGERRGVRYMHREGEVVLPELLAKLGIERPVLFGHSDGGSIALIFAGARPRAVAGLVLEAPHVFVEEHSIRGIAAAKDAYMVGDLAAKLGRYHRDVNRTFWAWNDIWLDPHFRAWNIEAYVGRVTCPVLLLQGCDDEYGTRAQVDAIAAGTADARLVMLDGCGHAPHRERSEATLAATAAFLERLTTRRIDGE